MTTLKTFDSSVVSFIILAIILFHSYSRREKLFAQYKLFTTLVILTMSMIVIDLLGWVFNGLPGSLNLFLNTGFNLLLYIGAPTVPTAWVLYVYYLVNSDEKRIRRARTIFYMMLAANALMSVASLRTGWFFYVDAANIYHRGALFLIHLGYCEALLFYSFFFIVARRKALPRRQFLTITVFFIAPFIGMLLQAIVYGVSYNWVGVTISLLITYFNLQSRNLNTDFLTGVNNRLYFQNYLREKIRGSSEKKTFGAIMADIDHFKSINDTYGHATGDEALKDAVKILKSALRRDDFISRFGGDEFLMIIDAQSREDLEEAVSRIKAKTEEFNSQSTKPYRLCFSLGYDIYPAGTRTNPDAYIDRLDQKMYEDKRGKLAVES
jgi:diguanylate cyclase (GGDEF)-like protein